MASNYPNQTQSAGNNQNSGNQSSRQFNTMGYTVDMVFCIDATGSMEDISGSQTKIINVVKQNAVHFYDDVMKKMQGKNKVIRQIRVRIVAFRDYLADGNNAMLVTDFFLLPQQSKEFEACVNSIHADGGGDIPEDGLEALAYAIKSAWTMDTAKKRHVIVLWTDAGAHDIGFGKHAPNYPKGMPQSLSELTDWWDSMNLNAKRLILFAPHDPNWDYIAQNWENVVLYPSVAGNGLAETGYNDILNVIANSV